MWNLKKRRITGLFVMGALILGTSQAQAEDDLPEELLMGGEGGINKAEKDGRMWWMGFQMHASVDDIPGPDTQSTNYGLGMGLAIPVTMEFYRGIGMRLNFAATYSGSPPLNAVEVGIQYDIPSSASGEATEHIAKTLDGYFTNVQLGTGLNYSHALLDGSVNPYGGLGPAFLLTYVFPDLEAEDDMLLDLADGESTDTSGLKSIDPYSVNVTAGFNVYGGVNFLLAESVHLNFEASYTQSLIPETRLENANEEQDYNARRSEFIYGALTFSTGLIWNF